jgi:hypothetical protein
VPGRNGGKVSTKIAEMQAGRELDAMVAERVMGWTDRADETAFGPELVMRPPTASGLHHRVPNYSTDPAADYAVLEHVRESWERDPWFRLQDRLRRLQSSRDHRHGREEDSACMYLPGDYSRAALLALEAQ